MYIYLVSIFPPAGNKTVVEQIDLLTAPAIVEDCVKEEAAESAPELGQVSQEAFVEPVTEDATVEQVADAVDATGEVVDGVSGIIAGGILPAVPEVAPGVAGFAAEEPVQAEVGAEEVCPIVES